jgi:hypothetical protein
MEELNILKMLSELPASGATDYATLVMEIYKNTMVMSELSERTYQATLEKSAVIYGFSTSTNG